MVAELLARIERWNATSVEQLFPDVDPVGKHLRIEGKPVRIVGVAEKKGSFLGFSQDKLGGLRIGRATNR